MRTDKKISVVAACYNEAENIQPLYERITRALQNITSDYEIIFGDNASTDGSERIFEDIASKDHRVSVLFMSRNFGSSQPSFTAGSEYATGDAVIWMDGDLQDPPELIEAFVKKWLEGYEIVYGVRNRRKGSALRKLGYKIFYRVFKWFSYVDIPLDSGDFCLIDRKAIAVLNAMPERDRFLRGLRAWLGFRHIGVSYARDNREHGASRYNIFNYLFWTKRAIVSFSYLPLQFISYLAIFIVGFSFLFILWMLFSFFFFQNTPKGFTTVIVLMLFLGGIQLLSLAVIGEYVGRIFEEVKGRPKYILRNILNNHRTHSATHFQSNRE